MCGRYAASVTGADLIETFEVDVDATDRHSRSLLVRPQQPQPGDADYNMAPSKQAPVVLSRESGERQLRLLSWGLVPPWAKETAIGMRMINARAESLLDKRSFAAPTRRRRALIPAGGWYEWQKSPVATDAKGKPRKQPFFVARADQQPMAFGGIYEFWKDRTAEGDGEENWVVSFSIITRAAEPGLDRIHDRQPLVIEPQDWAEWLDPGRDQDEQVGALIRAACEQEPGRFEAWAVGTAVNRVGAATGPSLIEPAARDSLVGVIDPSTGEVVGG